MLVYTSLTIVGDEHWIPCPFYCASNRKPGPVAPTRRNYSRAKRGCGSSMHGTQGCNWQKLGMYLGKVRKTWGFFQEALWNINSHRMDIHQNCCPLFFPSLHMTWASHNGGALLNSEAHLLVLYAIAASSSLQTTADAGRGSSWKSELLRLEAFWFELD